MVDAYCMQNPCFVRAKHSTAPASQLKRERSVSYWKSGFVWR